MKTFSSIAAATAFALLSACSTPAPTNKAVTADSTATNSPAVAQEAVKVGSTKLDTLLYATFTGLKHKSVDELMKLAPSREQMMQLLISMAPPGQQAKVKEKLKEDDITEEERRMSMDAFKKAISRGDELKINWNNIVYKGGRIDSTVKDGMKTYLGEISFADGARNFHIKYDDCIKMGNSFVMTSLYTPYEDLSAQNAGKCEKYRAAYMRTCLRIMKMHPDPRIKLSPEEYCSCSFNNIAKQSGGESLLKDTIPLQIQPGNCAD